MRSVSVHVFFNATGSVRPFLWFFLGGEYVCPSYGPKIPKIGKIGTKIRAFVYKQNFGIRFLPKNVKKSLNYRRCDI